MCSVRQYTVILHVGVSTNISEWTPWTLSERLGPYLVSLRCLALFMWVWMQVPALNTDVKGG